MAESAAEILEKLTASMRSLEALLESLRATGDAGVQELLAEIEPRLAVMREAVKGLNTRH